MKDVLVFGEMLMRLTPPNNAMIGQNSSFDLYFGGAEVNVAVGLRKLGIYSKVLTALPKNKLGEFAKSFLRSNDVNCDFVIEKGDRLGIYYYEEGCSARRSKVIYDRKNSSINYLTYEDINICELFHNVELIHLSGITFGLGEKVVTLAYKIIEEARKRNIKISVDLNYRPKLFKNYSEFSNIIKPVIEGCYLCFGWLNEDTSKFEVLDGEKNISNEDLYKNFYYTSKKLGVQNIVTTLRTATLYNNHSLQGIFYDGNNIFRSSKYNFSIFSRIGAGDAFSCGIIKKILDNNGLNIDEIIEFGTAAAVLKQTQLGDCSIFKECDINDLIINKNIGKVDR